MVNVLYEILILQFSLTKTLAFGAKSLCCLHKLSSSFVKWILALLAERPNSSLTFQARD